MEEPCGRGTKKRNAERISAGHCADIQYVDPLRHLGRRRSGHAAVLAGGKEGEYAAKAPELSADTMWYYKPAHRIDQTWSVKAAGIRQRHIDQAQSMNLYITNEYTMRQVLELYLLAWKSGVKTIYYVRSKSLEVTDCDVCSS